MQPTISAFFLSMLSWLSLATDLSAQPFSLPSQVRSAEPSLSSPSFPAQPTSVAEPIVPSTTETSFKRFAGGDLVAVVGEETILAGDLDPFIESQLKEIESKVPADEFDFYRERIMRQALLPFVQNRMLAQLFINDQISGKPVHERQDARKQLDKRITEAFYSTVLDNMLKTQKVETPLELDRALRDEGTSLAAQFRAFKYTAIAQEALRQHVPQKFDVSLEELREYYDANVKDFQRPARVRFRELVADFKKSGSRESALDLIVQMGNEVYLGGTSFEAVAKRLSHGVNASDGGVYDWITQGSLKSKKIDEVVFSIPLRRLSLIIEDTDGLKIVEVLEREEARTVPFEESQLEIRDKISKQKKSKAQEELLARLREQTPIWSRWPEDIPGARPLAEVSETFAKPNSEGNDSK